MRVIVVHTVEHAITAIRAATQIRKPVILQSAPHAIRYAGALYLFHLFDTARRVAPPADTTCIVDCGEARAEAISAMQMGHRHIRLASPDPALEAIAREHDIALVHGPYEALDLLDCANPHSACAAWLETDEKTD